MLEDTDIPARVSFGMDVTKPGHLETRTTGDILRGIAKGEWRDSVLKVRSLPPDSEAQKAAKRLLPFATLSGVFSYRRNDSLREHSGQIGVDLDGLGQAKAIATIQAAVADSFCLAAFRSTRGEGVRLLFRIPPCTPEQHGLAFDQVSRHVRNTYGYDADESGKDVSRASFVSYDSGLWLNPSANILPLTLPMTHSGRDRGEREARCVSSPYAGQLAITCWSWLGRNHAIIPQAIGDTVKTHQSILELGLAIALHAERIKENLTESHIDLAFSAWWQAHKKNGVRLRGYPAEYRRELQTSIEGARRKSWFLPAAEKWIRWTRHEHYPHDGKPPEKILFAARQHCTEARTDVFFIGSRDAGIVAGVSFCTAARSIKKLCKDGFIEKHGDRQKRRHAQTYRLKQ